MNVYLRIRPFIGDELEQGENQNLIKILDDKRIAVKIYPTIHNTIRTCQASYNEYEVRSATTLMIASKSKDFFRLLESLIIVVLNKIYSNKFLISLPMRYSLVRIGFSVHLV